MSGKSSTGIHHVGCFQTALGLPNAVRRFLHCLLLPKLVAQKIMFVALPLRHSASSQARVADEGFAQGSRSLRTELNLTSFFLTL